MITGYNTDLRHGETVLHVQTEDKGLQNPSIESVIYVKGQVLATKRSSYKKLLEEGKGEKDIAQMMELQHRTILAAIKTGRFDQKLDALLSGRGPDKVDEIEEAAERVTAPHPTAGGDGQKGRGEAAAEAGESGPTLDQVILEYLSMEAENEQLVLTLDSENEIRPGRVNHLTVRAYSSKSGLPISGVHVVVKMISTVSEPKTLFATETDEIGAIDLQVEVPAIDRGSAALIISGSSDLGRAEIKQLL